MATYRYSTKDLSITNAKAFVHNVTMIAGTDSDEDTSTEKKSNILYLAVGRTEEWDTEPVPDVPDKTHQHTHHDIHREFYGAKKVQPSDIRHVAPRYDWESGTVYAMYRNTDPEMFTRNWYVFTNEYNVYTCLYNNRGVPSTVKPTGFSTSPFQTSDGYIWKYMYTVSLDEANKFLTPSFIPVRTLTASDAGTIEANRQLAVQNAAVNGSIEVVETVGGGAGYEYVPEGEVAAGGKFTLRLSSAPTTNASAVDDIYNGSSIYVLSGTGAGQLRRIINYDGPQRTLTVNSAFSTVCNTDSRVVISPTMTIIGDGVGAQGYCKVDPTVGAVSNVVMIAKGSGYTEGVVRITANSVHGVGATANAIITPHGGHGEDPIRELGGDKVMINVQMDDNLGVSVTGKGYIPSNTEFRTVALIVDPVLKVNANNDLIGLERVANTSNSPNSLRLSTKLKVSYAQMDGDDPINPFNVNDVVTTLRLKDLAAAGGLGFITELGPSARQTASLQNALLGANGTIIYIRDAEDESDSSYYSLYLNNIESYGNITPFEVNDVLLKSTSAAEVATITEVSGPEANTFSGELLYFENIQVTTRDPDQIEDLKIIIDF
jgi:hypothetical protein